MLKDIYRFIGRSLTLFSDIYWIYGCKFLEDSNCKCVHSNRTKHLDDHIDAVVVSYFMITNKSNLSRSKFGISRLVANAHFVLYYWKRRKEKRIIISSVFRSISFCYSPLFNYSSPFKSLYMNSDNQCMQDCCPSYPFAQTRVLLLLLGRKWSVQLYVAYTAATRNVT